MFNLCRKSGLAEEIELVLAFLCSLGVLTVQHASRCPAAQGCSMQCPRAHPARPARPLYHGYSRYECPTKGTAQGIEAVLSNIATSPLGVLSVHQDLAQQCQGQRRSVSPMARGALGATGDAEGLNPFSWPPLVSLGPAVGAHTGHSSLLHTLLRPRLPGMSVILCSQRTGLTAPTSITRRQQLLLNTFLML